MGNARFRLTVLSAVTVLLGIVAFLQYRWIQRASDAEEERARSSLKIALSRVKEIFDSEIRKASEVVVQPFRPGGHEPFPPAVRLAQWRQTATRPKLIRQLLRISHDDRGPLVRDGETDTPINVPSNSPLAAHARRLLEIARVLRTPSTTGRPFGGAVSISTSQAIQLDEGPVLFGGIPLPYGPVEISAILLDQQYIWDRVLPDLIREATGSDRDDRFQFRVAISGKRERVITGPAWVSARQPEVSVTLLTSVVGFGLISSVVRQQGASSASGSVRDGTHTGQHGHDDGLWSLNAFAADAPLFSTFRQRNLLMSGSVLVILFAASCVLTIYTDRLRSLARTRSEIVMAISHELRTPITTIRVTADSMIKGLVDGPEQLKRYGTLIDTKSRDLERIAGDVVAFARSERTVSEYRSVEIRVDGLITKMLEDSRVLLDRAKLKPQVRIGEPAPVIAGDPDLLAQALRNLIENACKYAAGGERLIIECRSGRDGLAEILVEDRGPGIPSADVDLIFEPFYRGEAMRASKAGGIGLGLAIVKKIVENHGGSVKVSNAPQGGARFVLRLPAVKVRAA